MEWRDVPEWEGYYQVSADGQVRSLTRLVKYRDGRIRECVGAIRTLTPDSHGYLTVPLSRGGRTITVKVHALVLATFVGPKPLDAEILHDDDNPANNTVRNLRYGTHSENMQAMVRRGTHNMARKTHCPRGHELIGLNLFVAKTGSRVCIACRRARDQHRKDSSVDVQAYSDQSYQELLAGTHRKRKDARK